MKKILPLGFVLMIVSCVIFNKASGQYNLVPNPSFEAFDTCPYGGNLVRFAIPWSNPLYPSTPDYLNACDTAPSPIGVPDNSFGYEPARTGSAYMQIITYATNQTNPLYNHWREYIETELIDSLIAGVDYCINFYVSSVDSVKYTSNDLGMYFSNVKVQDTCPGQLPCNLTYIAQYQNPPNNNLISGNGWTLISGNYIAAGGEKYIVIGNFKDSASTTSVYKGFGQWNFAMYYIDDVLLTPCDSLTSINIEERDEIPWIFPNPAKDEFNIHIGRLKVEELNIFDSYGREIRCFNEMKNNQILINLNTQIKGIYFLTIKTKNKSYQFKLITI